MRAGLAGLSLAAAIALPAGAFAGWQVVGPGLAVGEARHGTAELGVECHDGQILLALYNLAWDYLDNDVVDLVIDGKHYPVRHLGFADHLAFFDTIGEGRHEMSAPVLAALGTGKEATFEGWVVNDVEPRDITFSLLGSEAAIDTVRKFCE